MSSTRPALLGDAEGRGGTLLPTDVNSACVSLVGLQRDVQVAAAADLTHVHWDGGRMLVVDITRLLVLDGLVVPCAAAAC